MVMLGLAALIMRASLTEIRQTGEFEGAGLQAAEIEDASFARSEAEAYIDASVSAAVIGSLVPPIEAGKTKRAADGAIGSAFGSLGLDAHVCNRHGGWENSAGGLSDESIGAITKAVAIKAGQGTAVTYIVTGGEGAGRKICAAIKRGNYSAQVEVPRGYIFTAAVPWQ